MRIHLLYWNKLILKVNTRSCLLNIKEYMPEEYILSIWNIHHHQTTKKCSDTVTL